MRSELFYTTFQYFKNVYEGLSREHYTMLMNFENALTLSDGGPYHIETSSLICKANKSPSFYTIGTSVMKALRSFFCSPICNASKMLWKHINLFHATRGPSIKYVCKIFRETNISNRLIRTRTSAYQRVENVSFLENCAYVLNGWPQVSLCIPL